MKLNHFPIRRTHALILLACLLLLLALSAVSPSSARGFCTGGVTSAVTSAPQSSSFQWTNCLIVDETPVPPLSPDSP